MELSEKNLLFQFLKEIQENKKTEFPIQKLENQLSLFIDTLKSNHPELSSELISLNELIYELNSEIKYQYFEYGIMAETLLDEFQTE